MRKFTPLGRYFGVAKAHGGNPLMNDKDRSNDSFLSFQEEELKHLDADLAADFLQIAKLSKYHYHEGADSVHQQQ